jgi:ADP-ribose pyrophosphatase
LRIFGTQKLTDFPHLNLYSTHYEDQRGNPKDWIFASRQEPPRMETGQWDIPDAVIIVPYHVHRQELVVIEEFRVALGGYQYGFPAGLVDEGETVAATCERELHEETGLSLQRILRQSPPVYSSSGLTDESVSMVFVECKGTPSKRANGSSEDIRVLFIDPSAAERLCLASDHRMDVKAWIVMATFARFGFF